MSSTNSKKSDTSFLYNLRYSSEALLNVVTYVCNEHMTEVMKYEKSSACSCYILSRPTFVALSAEVRNVANTFLPNSFLEELIGGKVTVHNNSTVLFSERAVAAFTYRRPSKGELSVLTDEIYIYVDPAFTATSTASGTGIAVLGRADQTFVILGVEELYLSILTGSAAVDIGKCALECIQSVIRAQFSPTKKLTLYICVEGNTSQDSAVMISYVMSKGLSSYNYNILFYHTIAQGSTIKQPYYLLNKEKSEAVDLFIKLFNSRQILIAQNVACLTLPLNEDPAEFLTSQLKNLTCSLSKYGKAQYTAKTKKTSDDMLISVIMSSYIYQHMEKTSFSSLN